MPDPVLEISEVTSRDRPDGVPRSAVERRIAYRDREGRPVDREAAYGAVVTYYDRAGNPVYTEDLILRER